MEATVFNIQRFSLDDGPGIRTTVFLKGCNLKCRWCHNPESISQKPSLMFMPDRCIGCGECVKVCKSGAHKIEKGVHVIDRELCISCFSCADACPSRAVTKTGEKKSADEILSVILSDKEYYETSGGGVTFSGGEPLLQADFLTDILKKCKTEGIHTAVDTAGNIDFSQYEKILPYTDLFLFDVKMIDPHKHKAATGAGNEKILENLKKLGDSGCKIWVRTPAVHGYHDKEEIEKIAETLKEIKGIEKIDLLPYHKYGIKKYDQLGLEYSVKDGSLTDDEEKEFKKILFM